jgi:hypothetical protein
LYDRVKTNAMHKIKNHYNWDLIGNQTLTLYNEVINEYKHSRWIHEDFKNMLKGFLGN